MSTIGIDFDDVLVPFMWEFVMFCESRLNKNFDFDSIGDYSFKSAIGYEFNEALEFYHEFVNSDSWIKLHNVAPSEECKTTLKRLKEKGHKLVIITAREDRFKEITEDFLERHFPGVFTEMYFGNLLSSSGQKFFKSELCQKAGCSLLIDDNPKYILEVQSKGISGILFGDWPWTRIHNHSVRTWQELYNKLC